MNLQKSILLLGAIILSACSSQEQLSYLNNLPDTSEPQYFQMDMPDYLLQPRDILYITAKALTPEGLIEDLLLGSKSPSQTYLSTEASQFIVGYSVDNNGEIFIPTIGFVKVSGLTIKDVRDVIQSKADNIFNNCSVEVKLLSFKFTVLGEARNPGSFINYNNYLTIFEAIGRAGGVGDYGRRDRVLVLRPTNNGTKSYVVNLQDKGLLSSEAYFLQANDVVIIEPIKHKIFNLNLPTFSFILVSVTSTITTALLLVNFFGK